MKRVSAFIFIMPLTVSLMLSGCLGQAFETAGGARYKVRDLNNKDPDKGQSVVSRKLDDFGNFEISANGNWYSLPDTIKNYAFLRAAELTLLNGACCFEIVDLQDTTITTGGGRTADSPAENRPWIRLEPNGSYSRGTSYIPAMAGTALPTYNWYGQKLQIKTVSNFEMQRRQRSEPNKLKGVVDAEQLYRTLSKKVMGTPTPLKELYLRDFVEAERLAFWAQNTQPPFMQPALYELVMNQNRPRGTQALLNLSRIEKEEGNDKASQNALLWALLWDRSGVVDDIYTKRGQDPQALRANFRAQIDQVRYKFLLKQ